jgi:aerobic carbon-monoxide dehydrogenase small subunit
MTDERTSGIWVDVELVVNGQPRRLVVPADRRLAAVLREDLRLTGTKLGCEVGVCGACTVLVDGRQTSSCLTLAAQVDGAEITTVEGLVEDPALDTLREAFIEEGAFQCGFCTSGQLTNAAPLVIGRRGSGMTREELARYLHGNLCRCTGYYGILRAIERASR